MLTTDTDLEVVDGLATALDTHFDELTDTGLVEAGEWVDVDHFSFLIGWQEGAGVVAAEAETGLGEVVSSEAEELSVLSNFVCSESRTWDLNHGADGVFQLAGLDLVLGANFGCGFVDDGTLELELLGVTDEWDHDFRKTLMPFF